MKTKLNRVHNPSFAEGKAGPRGWVWSTTSKVATWKRARSDEPSGAPLMTITQERSEGASFWSQFVVCKPGGHYRIEATITCDLAAGDKTDDLEPCGFVLAVEPWAEDQPGGDRRITPSVTRSSKPIAVRTYYRAPDKIRRLELSVGLVNARGTVHIHDVRFIQILEPDETAHILAIPPPPHAVKAPRVAKRVAVCSQNAQQRPVTRLLAACFGESKVAALTPERLQTRSPAVDAVLLPDAVPPPSVRSLTGLLKLAQERTVVISLPAFARLVGETLSLRRVEQDDDPIHAKVVYANHATRGFALDDVFPYAWCKERVGGFVQNQYRRTEAFKVFCKKHGFEILLASMCDRDVTSNRAICLYKDTPGGGLFVLDIEPVEADPSTYGEPVLAMHILLSILGQIQTHLGQYVSPEKTESEFRGQIREMSARFEHFVVHEANLPIEEVKEQVVSIGREAQTYGLALAPRPVILVRSGFTPGDHESVYGAFVWFKQFVRAEPYACSYIRPLASQFRLAWVPCVARWESRDGWMRTRPRPTAATTIETEASHIAVLIDVVSRPVGQPRVVFAKESASFRHSRTWLPSLAAAFPPGPGFGLYANRGRPFCDRDAMAWQRAPYDVQVAVESTLFKSDAHREVLAAGGEVIRVEIPSHEADFVAYSIRSTDLTATLLEHVIGLQFGLIAVNRRPIAVRFNALPPVKPGEAVLLDHRDPVLCQGASQAG